MSNQIKLLTELDELTERPLQEEDNLKRIHAELAKKLDTYSSQRAFVDQRFSQWFEYDRAIKFISAAILWFLLASFAPFMTDNQRVAIGIFAVAFGVFIGFIGVLIPTFLSVWINALIYLVSQLLVFWQLSKRGRST